MRNLRAGHPYVIFQTRDSIAPKLAYFVYEASAIDYLVIDLTDSIRVYKAEKEVTVERRKGTATITSSLWNSMLANDMSPALAMELSDIYAWSIDFFALQPNDKFTVIYEQRYVDTTEVGFGKIWGHVSNTMAKSIMPFRLCKMGNWIIGTKRGTVCVKHC